MMEAEVVSILLRYPYLRSRKHLYNDRYKEQLLEKYKEFQQQFASEEACYQYLFSQKWPDGFRCPRCNHSNCTVINTRKSPLYQCHSCCHQTTLLANTMMEQSRLPLKKWLSAFFFLSLASIGIGVNALQLHLLLKVTYKTAWLLHKKIRHAISSADGRVIIGSLPNSLSAIEQTVSQLTNTSNVDVIESTAIDHTPLSIHSVTTPAVTPPTASSRSEQQPDEKSMKDFAYTYGIMFERAAQNRPIMIGFRLNQSSEAIHDSYKHGSQLVSEIKLKYIARSHMIDNQSVCSTYIETFKEQHFSKYLSPVRIIHSPRMTFRNKKIVQRAFDTMMKRFYQTYGTIRNKYLSFYLDEISFYYTAANKSNSVFQQLAITCMRCHS